MRDATPSIGPLSISGGIAQSVSSRAGITLLLERLRQQHCLLAIKPDSHDTVYTSLVLEVEPQRRYYVLDALTPDAGNAVLCRDRHLHATAHSEGIDLTFRGKVTAVAENAGAVYYRVPFPEAIEYRQKREHRRVLIPLAQRVPILLQTDPGAIIRGELRDISPGGCNIRLTGATVELAERDVLPRCVITLPAATRITATIEICHVAPTGTRRPHRIGARFYNLSRGDERRIEQFIAFIDREGVARSSAA